MAKIYTKIFRIKNENDKNFKELPPFISTGVIITDKSILTCGHCICNYKEMHPKQFQNALKLTCKPNYKPHEKSENYARNVNIEGSNEVYYTIGDKLFIPKFNNHIKAYVYNYNPSDFTPPHKYISRNGDIAVIIDIQGLGLAKHRSTPICLPNQNIFSLKSDSYPESLSLIHISEPTRPY